MREGKELALKAMKKEHSRLARAAERAKAEADEATNATGEFSDIHDELTKIVKSGEVGDHVTRKLNKLKARLDRVKRVMAKDYVALLDKQAEAEAAMYALAGEISNLEWRLSAEDRRAQRYEHHQTGRA